VPEQAEEVPEMNIQEPETEAPMGFWADLVSSLRQELKPPYIGFFTTGDNAPVKGILRGNFVILRCSNSFTLEMVNKPAILDMISRKATAILGRPVHTKAEDAAAKPQTNEKLERLMDFGRAHSHIVNINHNEGE